MIDLLNWPGGCAAAALLAAAGLWAIRLTRDHRDTLAFQGGLFLVAFGLRFAAGVAIYGGGLLSVVQDEDSRGWTGGITFMRRWMEFGFTDPSVVGTLHTMIGTENRGYQSLLGVFFMLTRLVGRLPATAFTAAIGAMGVVLTYRLARTFATDRAARWVGAAVTVMPIMIVWASQTIKEPVVIAIEAAALYAIARVGLGSRAPRHWLLACAALVLVIPFRFYIAYALGAGFVFVIWRNRAAFAGSRAVRLAATALVVAVLAVLTREVVRREQPGLQRVQQFREAVSRGGTATSASERSSPQRPRLATLDVRKPWQIPLVVAIGSTYALLSPFPWQFRGGSWRFLLTLPDMLIWWALFFAVVVPGTWRALRRGLVDVAPLVLFLVMIGGLYSLMFANVGIAYRQRAQLVPVLLVIAAAGWRPTDRAAS